MCVFWYQSAQYFLCISCYDIISFCLCQCLHCSARGSKRGVATIAHPSSRPSRSPAAHATPDWNVSEQFEGARWRGQRKVMKFSCILCSRQKFQVLAWEYLCCMGAIGWYATLFEGDLPTSVKISQSVCEFSYSLVTLLVAGRRVYSCFVGWTSRIIVLQWHSARKVDLTSST